MQALFSASDLPAESRSRDGPELFSNICFLVNLRFREPDTFNLGWRVREQALRGLSARRQDVG